MAARFLADGKADLDVPVGQILLLCDSQRLQDGGNARFIVAAEGRRAIGVEHAVPFDDPRSRRGRHGIHVGLQKEPHGTGPRPGQKAPHVARRAAAGAAGVIDPHLQAQGLQLPRQQRRFFRFLQARAGHADQLDKGIFQPFFLYIHCQNLFSHAVRPVRPCQAENPNIYFIIPHTTGFRRECEFPLALSPFYGRMLVGLCLSFQPVESLLWEDCA